jgi:hypothetical protein
MQIHRVLGQIEVVRHHVYRTFQLKNALIVKDSDDFPIFMRDWN